MATWEDGPEYAPLERPDVFAEPTEATISLAAPPVSPPVPPAPADRPAFADPNAPVPPLASLVPLPPAGRDPEQPFDVVSSLMTAESSAWASAHWTAAPTPAPAPTPATGPAPVPPAFPPPTGPPPVQQQFPAPGTPQWFASGGYQPPAPAPRTLDARAVLAAATPGVLVTLVIGAFIWVLAPITMVVAFLLTRRMTYGVKPTRTAFAAVLAFLGLIGLVSVITADGSFTGWWDTVAAWACFGSWVMLVATVVAVYRELRRAP